MGKSISKFDNLYNSNFNKLFKLNFENTDLDQHHMDLKSVQNKFEEVILHYISYYQKSLMQTIFHFLVGVQ